MDRYLLSQICVIIATMFIGTTFLVNKKKTVMLLCICYCIFYCTHYFLLGAITGAVMTMISIARNVWFYNNSKKNKRNSIYVLLALAMIAIITGLLSYNDVFSLVSISASILSTYSVWQDDVNLYKWLAIPVSVAFIVYAIHIGSTFAIITEAILLFVEVVGVVKMLIDKKLVMKKSSKEISCE